MIISDSKNSIKDIDLNDFHSNRESIIDEILTFSSSETTKYFEDLTSKIRIYSHTDSDDNNNEITQNKKLPLHILHGLANFHLDGFDHFSHL